MRQPAITMISLTAPGRPDARIDDVAVRVFTVRRPCARRTSVAMTTTGTFDPSMPTPVRRDATADPGESHSPGDGKGVDVRGLVEGRHHDVSMKAAERVLLPAIRDADDDVLLVTDGCSCREEIEQAGLRQPLHPAEVLAMATEQRDQQSVGDRAAR